MCLNCSNQGRTDSLTSITVASSPELSFMVRMADDAQPLFERCCPSHHLQEARSTQPLLSWMHTFRQAMSLRDAVYFAMRHSRKEGNFIPKLVNSEYWDTPIGMRIIQCWFLLSQAIQNPIGLMHGFSPSSMISAMYPLEESIHFATTRLMSKTVLNDAISFTASMQTNGSKWNDSEQAFNNQLFLAVANSNQANPSINMSH